MDQTGSYQSTDESNRRILGWALLVTSILSCLIMANHPLTESQEMEARTAEVIREASMYGWVHGSLIFMVGLNLVIFYVYARWRGLEKLLVLIGLFAFAIGSMTMIATALLDGFIIPDYIARYSGATAERLQHFQEIRGFYSSAGKAMANLSSIAMSIGIIFWSVELLGKQRMNKAIGSLGIAIGVSVSLGLMLDQINLNFDGMMAVLLAWSLWYLCISYLLISRSSMNQKLS